MSHILGMCVPLTGGIPGIPHAVHLHCAGGDAAPAQCARVARCHLHLHQRHRESQGGKFSLLPLVFTHPARGVLGCGDENR